MNPNEAGNAVQAETGRLLSWFCDLNYGGKIIFWMYYLHIHTNGKLGVDPHCPGSIYHYRTSQTVIDCFGSHGRFRYHAKQVVPKVQRFFVVGVRPIGEIPNFLIPRDGGRRPDIVTLENLRFVCHPHNPAPTELWDE